MTFRAGLLTCVSSSRGAFPAGGPTPKSDPTDQWRHAAVVNAYSGGGHSRFSRDSRALETGGFKEQMKITKRLSKCQVHLFPQRPLLSCDSKQNHHSQAKNRYGGGGNANQKPESPRANLLDCSDGQFLSENRSQWTGHHRKSNSNRCIVE